MFNLNHNLSHRSIVAQAEKSSSVARMSQQREHNVRGDAMRLFEDVTRQRTSQNISDFQLQLGEWPQAKLDIICQRRAKGCRGPKAEKGQPVHQGSATTELLS